MCGAYVGDTQYRVQVLIHVHKKYFCIALPILGRAFLRCSDWYIMSLFPCVRYELVLSFVSAQSSFVGAIAIGDLIKSTLGPKGMVS